MVQVKLPNKSAKNVDKVVRYGKRARFMNNGKDVFVIRHLEISWYTDKFENYLIENGIDVKIITPTGEEKLKTDEVYNPYDILNIEPPNSENIPPEEIVKE